MKQKFSIPSPCSEDWSKMTDAERGKFCSACQKKVVDFTQFTHKEIEEFKPNFSSQKVCGRFYSHQLNDLNKTSSNHSKSNLLKVAASTILLLSAKAGFSQKVLGGIAPISNTIAKDSLKERVENETKEDTLKQIINTQILDSISNRPIAFVLIKIKELNKEVISDNDGEINVFVDSDFQIPDSITLVIESHNINRVEIKLNQKQIPFTDKIYSEVLSEVTKGFLVIEKETVSYTPTKKWWQFWKRKPKH